jgi:hypothetical protein
VPEIIGRYRVSVDGSLEQRIVGFDPREITTAPREPEARAGHVSTAGATHQVDASPQVALLLLVLLALELVLRALGRFRPRVHRRKLDRPSIS